MLSFTKRKKRKTFAVPAVEKTKVSDIVDSLVESNRPDQALGKIRKTKVYIEARLNGASKKEAKELAGHTGSTKQLLSSPVAQSILESLLAVKFNDQKIVDRLEEMWSARNEITTTGGRIIGDKPDRDMQKYAMDKVLELRNYKKNGKSEDANNNTIPAQVVFNVLPLPVVPKNVTEKTVEIPNA